MSRVEARARGLPAVFSPPELPGLGEAEARELREIYRETDSDLRDASLLAFGARLEQANRPEAAAGVYATVAGPVRTGQPGWGDAEEPMRRRASLRLDALEGRGAAGPRVELLLRQFSRQATDPATIVPMMLGTAVFGLARGAALSRLLGSAEASWFTRGWGARFAATGLGFGAELPAFVFSARALSGVRRPLGQDLLGAGLTLGALKAFGWAGHRVQAAAAGRPIWERIAKPFPALSVFTGLLAAHRLEESLGLRPRLDGATTFTDALVATVSLGVGARLGRALLGSRFARFQAEWNVRAELSAESRLRARMAASQPAGKVPWLPLPAPGPMMIFMGGTSLERLFRWLEQRLYPREERWENLPSQVTRQRMEGTMRVLLRRFPKLRKVLARSPWTLEQKWELLKAVTPNAQREPWEVFQHLPKALMVMEEEGWPYERQLGLLHLISRVGEFPVPIQKHLPGALAALRECAWPPEERFHLLYNLAKSAGPNADRVYANLPAALRAMREAEWTRHEQSDFLELLTRHADAKVGGMLAHLPAALRFLKEHEWTFAQQARVLLMIADRAPSDLQASWMMEEHLPGVLGMMAELDWNTSTQSRFLGRLLDRAGEQSPVAMEYLPGLLQSMQKFGWRPNYIYETLWEIFELGGGQSGKLIEVMPILLQTMRYRGLEMPTQREILEALAPRASELSKLAFIQFALSLVSKPLHWKPS